MKTRSNLMPKVFMCSDLHFGHEKIIQYESRPYKSTYDMDKALIKNWNSVVSGADLVYVLGDFSFHSKDETTRIVNSLNGKKILVMGNHDMGRSIKWWYDTGFYNVSKHPIIINQFTVLQHEPPSYYNDATPFFLHLWPRSFF